MDELTKSPARAARETANVRENVIVVVPSLRILASVR
jgi:hypothetical protein